ncbi:MAG: hypothetical protein ACTS44_01890 [Candidatus Hodgkinia cicadicola]
MLALCEAGKPALGGEFNGARWHTEWVDEREPRGVGTLTGGQWGNSLRDCQVPNVEGRNLAGMCGSSADGCEVRRRCWTEVRCCDARYLCGRKYESVERTTVRKLERPRPEISNLPAAVRAETKVDLPSAFRPIKMDNSPGESFMFKTLETVWEFDLTKPSFNETKVLSWGTTFGTCGEV